MNKTQEDKDLAAASGAASDIVKKFVKMDIAELLEVIEGLKSSWGITDEMIAAPGGSSAAASNAAPAEEVKKNLVLTEIKDKLPAIKGIRAFTGCSLGEANTTQADVVAGKKFILKEDAAKEDLQKAQETFGTSATVVLENA